MGLFRLINKDVAFENETRQGVVTLRLLYIIQAVVVVLDVFFAGFHILSEYKFVTLGTLAAIVVLFLLTYWMKTEPAMVAYIVFTFLLVPWLIPILGWKGGIQDYYVVILMLCFFANFGSVGFKFALAGVVFFARLLVFMCYTDMASNLPIDDLGLKLIQITNNSGVFLSVIIVSFIFSHRENEAESKLMKYNDRLVREANTDQLTGLYNRRRGMEFIEEIKGSSFLGSVSIVMGDIDFFKKVNDTYGHDAGDEVLRSIAGTMQDTIGRDAFLIRWGGEEFLMIFGGKNGDETLGIIENLRVHIMEHPIVVKDNEISVTMTFGLAEYDFSGDVRNTVKEADSKLYMGKERGRNRVVY